jgi:hypothetical protein
VSNTIPPVSGTNNIRFADFVRLTYPGGVYRFSTSATVQTIPSIDSQPFSALGQLVKVGEAQRDIKSTANETTFTLIGIDQAMLGYVLGQNVKGAQIEAWHGFFDTSGVFMSNLVKYSNTFTNAAWSKTQITSLTANTTETTDPIGTNTATKVILSGATDPTIGQFYDTGASIAGKTFTFSIWAKTATGQPTGGQVFIYDQAVTYVGQTNVTLTTSWQRVSVTYTFPSGTSGTGFFIRYDPPDTPVSGNYVYIYGAQLQYGAAVSAYVPTTSAANSGLYKFFTGYISSFTISEQWMEEARSFVGVITVSASSIQLILQNKVGGRFTNDNNWQYFNPGDSSMNRTAVVQNVNYWFGKGATSES